MYRSVHISEAWIGIIEVSIDYVHSYPGQLNPLLADAGESQECWCCVGIDQGLVVHFGMPKSIERLGIRFLDEIWTWIDDILLCQGGVFDLLYKMDTSGWQCFVANLIPWVYHKPEPSTCSWGSLYNRYDQCITTIVLDSLQTCGIWRFGLASGWEKDLELELFDLILADSGNILCMAPSLHILMCYILIHSITNICRYSWVVHPFQVSVSLCIQSSNRERWSFSPLVGSWGTTFKKLDVVPVTGSQGNALHWYLPRFGFLIGCSSPGFIFKLEGEDFRT